MSMSVGGGGGGGANVTPAIFKGTHRGLSFSEHKNKLRQMLLLEEPFNDTRIEEIKRLFVDVTPENRTRTELSDMASDMAKEVISHIAVIGNQDDKACQPHIIMSPP